MLVFGPLNLAIIDGSFEIYNCTGMNQNIPNLNILPSYEFRLYDEETFTQNYINYIYKNDNIFFEFMSKVILNLYQGRNVYLVTSNLLPDIPDTLSTILSDRYGYVTNTINEPEDWSTVVEGSFMPECMRFLDGDLQRYRELFIKFNGVDTYNKINDRMNGE